MWTIELTNPSQCRLDLYDPKTRTADAYMGYILLDVELKPKSLTDKVGDDGRIIIILERCV